MKQKLLILMCAIMATITASADRFVVDNIAYSKTSETTCEVVEVRYGLYGVIIPETVIYNDHMYIVNGIGDGAFNGHDDLMEISIPNSVTYIGEGAFTHCVSLTSIEIPNSVTSIGEYAFMFCFSLTSIEIPNSVTSIGESAFYYCSSLTSIEIPNSVTSIGAGAFINCTSLEAFYGKYASDDNRCLIVEGALIGFAQSGLTAYSIPESVTSIGEYAFYGCRSLTSIEIPNSVTSIGYRAFRGCSSLTSITVNNSDPANILLSDDVFYDVPKSTCTLFVPKGSKELYAKAYQWKDFENIVEFDDATSIEDIEVDTQTDDIYYDLTGRRVVNPAQGIYIHNGRKVYVK